MKKFRQLNPKLSKSALSFPKGTSLLLQRPALENSAPAAESKKSALSLQDSGQKTEDRRLLFVDDKSTAAPPPVTGQNTQPPGNTYVQNFGAASSASQSFLQGASQGLGTTVSSFVGSVGQVSQAGLEICKVAEVLINIHTKMADALTKYQEFRLCTDIAINQFGSSPSK